MCRDRAACVSGLIGGKATIRFTADDPPTPNGCRWCGVTERAHGSRWVPGAGFHWWCPPTRGQRMARLKAFISARERRQQRVHV